MHAAAERCRPELVPRHARHRRRQRDICFLSSNAWAASHYGLRVVWVNRFAQPPERLPGHPDAEIDTLEGLPPLLGV